MRKRGRRRRKIKRSWWEVELTYNSSSDICICSTVFEMKADGLGFLWSDVFLLQASLKSPVRQCPSETVLIAQNGCLANSFPLTNKLIIFALFHFVSNRRVKIYIFTLFDLQMMKYSFIICASLYPSTGKFCLIPQASPVRFLAVIRTRIVRLTCVLLTPRTCFNNSATQN